MARKLPWAVNDAPAAKRSRPSPPARPKQNKESLSNPVDEEDDAPVLPSCRGRASETSAKKGSGFRTPSTSPIRAPPSVELMRNGYDKDDIYIMVEDEFQTVAQSYTAHLHHAEYRRLMREARTAPSKDLPEPTSPMSNEAKQRLQSAALQRKQGDVLCQVIGKTLTEQEEEDKIGELWSGTSLAPLMAPNSQQKTSLVGLERILSTTRASSGYSRPESGGGYLRDQDLENTEEQTSIRPGSYSRPERRAQSAQGGSDRTGQRFHPRSTGLATEEPPGKPRRSRSSIHDINDEEYGGGNSGLNKNNSNDNSARPKAHALGTNFMKRKRDKEKEKQSRLDDVPMFII